MREVPYLGVSRDSLANKFIIHSSPVPSDPAGHDVSLDALKRVTELNNMIKVFDPKTALCPITRCSFEMEDLRGAFRDESHLSRKGSDLLAPELAKLISTMIEN